MADEEYLEQMGGGDDDVMLETVFSEDGMGVRMAPWESGEPRVTVQLHAPRTQQAVRAVEIMRRAMNRFIDKNAGYGEPVENDDDGLGDLGSAGQWADMHRKIKLIRRHLWDKQPWTHHEPFEQVCEELIGHLLLTIDFKERDL